MPAALGTEKVALKMGALVVKLRAQYEHMNPRHYTIADTCVANDADSEPAHIPHDDAKCGAV